MKSDTPPKRTAQSKRSMPEYTEAELDELREVKDDALRRRYGVDPGVGKFLDQLKAITRSLANHDPSAQREILSWVLDVGHLVMEDALHQRTNFLDDLRSAINADAGGLQVTEKIRLAYDISDLEIKRAYIAQAERGEHRMEDAEAALPTTSDVIEAYLRMNPHAKYESSKTQVKRWLKETGRRTVTKRRQPK